MDITKTILSDPVNKWVFKSSDAEVFLVGGYVRDLLRGHISNDRDFALKDSVENIAIETAKKFNGTFVVLKPHQTYRVILKNRETIDFSFLKNTINNDLKERDFTIDSIAWSPKTGLVDLFGGRKDLENHIIKAVRIKNLTDDPLRIIRAYRIAAELGFRIDGNTRKYLKRYSKSLAKVASERITEEIFKILNNEYSSKHLNECYKDTVLEKIFAPTNTIKKADSLSKNINTLNKFDLFLKTQLLKVKKSLEGRKITSLLKEEISQGINRLGLIRLSILLKDGSISRSRLRVSNIINISVRDIHNGYAIAEHKITDKEVYKIFDASRKSVYEVALLLSFLKKENIKKIFKRANEYIKVKNKILLNGNDVQKILNIKPGINIGEILSALQEQQHKGLVKTRAQAMKWLLVNFT